MITISSYWNSNPGLRITSYMKNIYIKVHSDNHYTIRAYIYPPAGTTIFFIGKILKPIMLRRRGFEPLTQYESGCNRFF